MKSNSLKKDTLVKFIKTVSTLYIKYKQVNHKFIESEMQRVKVNLEKECLEELDKIFKDIVKSNDYIIKTIASRKGNKIITGYLFHIKYIMKSKS